MIHFFILLFFGTVLTVGLYCLWVALRVEHNRAPKSMRFNHDRELHSVMGTSTSVHSTPHAH